MQNRIAVIGDGLMPVPVLRRPMYEIITDQRVLSRVSKETTWELVKELNLKERLKEAMKGAWVKGCGLAAIQIGVPLRYAYYQTREEDKHLKNPVIKIVEHELLNPKLIEGKYYMIMPKEGCLSIPNTWSRTRRWGQITYLNDGKECKAFGIEAFIIQHEIDHMDGILNLARRFEQYPKTGRNKPCPCGSGKKYKKYKKCCIDGSLRG